jgi:hypothetical protein
MGPARILFGLFHPEEHKKDPETPVTQRRDLNPVATFTPVPSPAAQQIDLATLRALQSQLTNSTSPSAAQHVASPSPSHHTEALRLVEILLKGQALSAPPPPPTLALPFSPPFNGEALANSAGIATQQYYPHGTFQQPTSYQASNSDISALVRAIQANAAPIASHIAAAAAAAAHPLPSSPPITQPEARFLAEILARFQSQAPALPSAHAPPTSPFQALNAPSSQYWPPPGAF